MRVCFTKKCLLLITAFVFISSFLIPSSFAAELKAGIAKTLITPRTNLKLTAGKLNDGTMLDMDGVDHDIYARALVLDDGAKKLVIITHDLSSAGIVTPILRKKCKDELGIDQSQLIIISTHNHQAPMPRWEANFPYLRETGNKMFEIVKLAIAHEEGPIKVEFGFGPGYWVRSTGNAPVDYEIQVLKVSHKKKPMAVLINQPAHPYMNSRTKIGVGHPGYAVDEIERLIPGVQAMYGDGCGGNQSAIPPDGKSANYDKNDQPRQLGIILANTVMNIMKTKMIDVTGPIATSMGILPLPLDKPYTYEEAKRLGADMPRNIGYDHDKYRGTNWLRALIRYYEQDIPFPTKTTHMYLHEQGYFARELDDNKEYPNQIEQVIVARIGPMPLVALQGEVCAPIGARIKDNFRTKMPIMLFAYMGEQEVYIPTRELVRQDAYQSQVIRTQYASPVGWAPEVEDEMVSCVTRMVNSIMGMAPK